MSKLGRCDRQVYHSSRSFGLQCSRHAVVGREGKVYCRQHDPVEIKRREAESEALRAAEWDARQQRATIEYAYDAAMRAACAGLTTEQLQGVAARGGFKAIVGEFRGAE